MRIPLIVVVLVSLVRASPAEAQNPGKLRDLSPASMALLAADMPESATRVEQTPSPKRDSRWNGFLIGLAVGAVPGVVLGSLVARYCDNEATNCDVAIPFFGGITGLIGGGIGFAIDGAIHDSRSFGPARPTRPGAGARLWVKF